MADEIQKEIDLMGLYVRLKKKLSGFSLDVEWEAQNETAALFGCSGAGKTMTLQMIAGLRVPDRGKILFDGKTLFDSSTGVNVSPQKRSFGYVFQDLALFPHMTVQGNILYGATGEKREDRESAKALMEIFRIDGLRGKYPGEISGGQKQRVALARALMTRPRMLLLDEPFSGLDYPIRLEMRKVLQEIRREFSIPVVLITHDLEEARSLADRMIIYNEGRVVQTGSPDAVLTSPAGPALKRLFGIDVPEEPATERFLKTGKALWSPYKGNDGPSLPKKPGRPAFSK